MIESLGGSFNWKDSVDVETSDNKVVKTTTLTSREGKKTTRLVNTDVIADFLDGVEMDRTIWEAEAANWKTLFQTNSDKFYKELSTSTEADWKQHPEKWAALVHFVNMTVSRNLSGI